MTDVRGRAILVPSHAAAEQLRRTIEDHRLAAGSGALVLPSLLTRADWRAALHADLPRPLAAVDGFEREVLLQAAARAAIADGCPPPFTIRPGLITEMLGFYDGVRRHGRTVDDFERVAVTALERDVDTDRGAVRMLEQTRFLVAAFRRYEARLADRGLLDEHGLRAAVLAAPSSRFTARHRRRRRSRGRHGRSLAVGFRPADAHRRALDPRDRRHRCRARRGAAGAAAPLASGARRGRRRHLRHAGGARAHRAGPGRGRVLAGARSRGGTDGDRARDVKRAHRRQPDVPLSRTAVVFKRPLPYVYLARQIFSSAGVPQQTFDALPLAAEPYAAAARPGLRRASIRASRRPRSSPSCARRSSRIDAAGRPSRLPAAGAASTAELSEARYLADPAELGRFAREWSVARASCSGPRAPRAARGGRAGIALGRRAAHGAPWHDHPLPRRARASAARAVARRGAPPQVRARRAHGLDAALREAHAPLRRCASPLCRDGGLRPPLDRAADVRSAPGHGRRPAARRRRRPLRRVRHDASGRADAARMARERRAEHLLSGLHAPGPSLARGRRRADG